MTATRSGIPTTYRYNAMRSRLEARWAAFFDLVGWSWVYEPFDADGWIRPEITPGLLAEQETIVLSPCGHGHFADGGDLGLISTGVIRDLWARAGSKVQWRR